MKKRCLSVLLSALLVISLSGCTSAVPKKKEGVFSILTSFYPMYVIALNVADGAENVEIRNLASPSTGCLHDYQMKPMDMVNMEQAGVMIINGAGMEQFLDDAREAVSDLHIIDTTEGLDLLESESSHSHDEEEHDHIEEEHDHGDENDVHEEEHDHGDENDVHEDDHDHEEDHDHDEEGHSHGEYNAHAWLSLSLYKQQVQIVADGLAKENPENAEIYQKNAQEYMDKIDALMELEEEVKPVTEGKKLVVLHESFSYLAKDLGMEVVNSLEVESDAGLSAGQIRSIIENVREAGGDLLISEKQYSGNIGHTLENEIGIQDITLDSCVTGKEDKDSYLKAMEENLKILKEAFSDGTQLRLSLY